MATAITAPATDHPITTALLHGMDDAAWDTAMALEHHTGATYRTNYATILKHLRAAAAEIAATTN